MTLRRGIGAHPASRGVGEVAALFTAARRPVAFTGAGVSTESGIPDFRSPGGVWGRVDPRAFTDRNFLEGVEGRRRYWAVGRATWPLIRTAAPGPTHLGLAELYRLGRLDCCITQNVDGLHQRAGLASDAVIELHGNAARARCVGCGTSYAREALHARLEAGVEVPDCEACGGVVKPHTVLFGEPLPRGAMVEAERRACAADLLLVLGSSLVVYPAAHLPIRARRAGAALAIVNLEPTPLDREADLVVRAPAAQAIAAVLAAEKGRTDAPWPTTTRR